MKRGMQVTLALLVGYILGRKRKLRMALLLGASAAAGRYGGSPTTLLTRGRELVGGSPALGELSGLARPLVQASKAAARTAVTDRIDTVSDRLRDRSDALRAAARPARAGLAAPEETEERREPRGRGRERYEEDEYEYEDRFEGEERYEDEERRGEPREAPEQEAAPARGGRYRDSEPEAPVRRRTAGARR